MFMFSMQYFFPVFMLPQFVLECYMKINWHLNEVIKMMTVMMLMMMMMMMMMIDRLIDRYL